MFLHKKMSSFFVKYKCGYCPYCKLYNDNANWQFHNVDDSACTSRDVEGNCFCPHDEVCTDYDCYSCRVWKYENKPLDYFIRRFLGDENAQTLIDDCEQTIKQFFADLVENKTQDCSPFQKFYEQDCYIKSYVDYEISKYASSINFDIYEFARTATKDVNIYYLNTLGVNVSCIIGLCVAERYDVLDESQVFTKIRNHIILDIFNHFNVKQILIQDDLLHLLTKYYGVETVISFFVRKCAINFDSNMRAIHPSKYSLLLNLDNLPRALETLDCSSCSITRYNDKEIPQKLDKLYMSPSYDYHSIAQQDISNLVHTDGAFAKLSNVLNLLVPDLENQKAVISQQLANHFDNLNYFAPNIYNNLVMEVGNL